MQHMDPSSEKVGRAPAPQGPDSEGLQKRTYDDDEVFRAPK